MEEMDKTVAVAAGGAEATVMGAPVTCPVCGTENSPMEKYCGECGFLLASTPGEAVDESEISSGPALTGTDGSTYYIREGENSVGRESSDLLLADSTVSRRHAQVVLEGGKCFVVDMGSTNGTFANGIPVRGERAEVYDGAELKFGSAVFTLSIPGGEPAPEVEEVEQVAPIAYIVTEDEQRFGVVPGTSTIGRRAGNAIVMSDAYVSGMHAEIAAGEDGFFVTDLGSTNGTTVNGTRLSPGDRTELADGDEVTFGQTKCRFEVL